MQGHEQLGATPGQIDQMQRDYIMSRALIKANRAKLVGLSYAAAFTIPSFIALLPGGVPGFAALSLEAMVLGTSRKIWSGNHNYAIELAYQPIRAGASETVTPDTDFAKMVRKYDGKTKHAVMKEARRVRREAERFFHIYPESNPDYLRQQQAPIASHPRSRR